MPKPKAPAWTSQEVAILSDIYPREGLQGASDALPGRSWSAIYMMASKLQLRSPVVSHAPEPVLQGERLEEAIVLRERDGWSFARIGAHLGVCEASACNAVLIALCPRKGFTPAQRDEHGRLTAEGKERLRYMLRKGLKGVDIQMRLGVSAGAVAEQRRRYQRELKERGKAPIPPAGGGAAYSGARIPPAKRKEVERLLVEGLGGPKVAAAVGVSKTHVQRIRAKLVRKLKRRGECLGGCDLTGKRVRVKDYAAAVPQVSVDRLRQLILDRVPVARAALLAGVGGTHAYHIRDELRAELEAAGETLPPIQRQGRKKAKAEDARAAWLPKGRSNLILYRRMLLQVNGNEPEARRLTVRAIAIRDGQDPSLAEQLDRMRRGAVAAPRFKVTRAGPDMTLGGVATGAL